MKPKVSAPPETPPTVEVSHVYLPCDSNDIATGYVDLTISESVPSSWREEISTSIRNCSYAALQRIDPLLPPISKDARLAFDKALNRELRSALNDPSRYGLFIERSGSLSLSDGKLAFLRGNVLVGSNQPFLVPPELKDISPAGTRRTSPTAFFQLLQNSGKMTLLVIAFTLAASIKSVLAENGFPFQAVLYITGRQGVGKTFLAKRICLTCIDASCQPVGVLQASSTAASVRDAAVHFRDYALVIDDLCLSADSDTQRSRAHVGSELIRIGSDASSGISKFKNGVSIVQRCEAGIVLTAEFDIDGRSEVTRCIYVPLKKRAKIADGLNNVSMSDAVCLFSDWLTAHHDEFSQRLRSAVGDSNDDCHDQRVCTNYAVLRAVFQEFMLALQSRLPDSKSIAKKLFSRFETAINQSLAHQDSVLHNLDEQVKKGNLAWIILNGLSCGQFELAKFRSGITKSKKAGIVLDDEEFCVKPEFLVHFVRQCPGFHDYTQSKIVQALKDYGALHLNLNGKHNAATVKFEGIRIYRIQLDRLKDVAQKY